MKKAVQKIVPEIVWLVMSYGLAVLVSWMFFGKRMLTDAIDIHLHDTYYVLAPLHILLVLFILITLFIYFIKEFRHSFQRTLPNWIFVIIGLTLIILLTSLIQLFSQTYSIEWTEYPPLSSTSTNTKPELLPDQEAKVITNVLMLFQGLILISLLFVVFRWGRSQTK